MLTTIHITVHDRVPTITAGEDVISHNSDYVVEFEFDEEWQDKVKTVYFVCEDGSYQAVVMSGNSCGVPMLDGEHRRIFVGVQAGAAEKPSVLKTTRPCCLKVKDSIADYLGQPIPDPTPDVYEQIIAMLESITSPTWEAVQNKPFSTLGSGLSVDENGVLSVPEGGGGSANAVQYVKQTLTDEQKTQARENIGAKAATEKSAYIISKTRSYGYIHTDGMDFDGVYAQIQSGKVVMLLVDDSSTYYGVITPTNVADKTIMFYNIKDISPSDVGRRNKGIEYFGFTWHKGDDSLTEWFGDIPRVEVDSTLTESGSAADAKTVGDALQNYVPAENYEENLQEIAQAIGTKLDKNQGTGNAGKILGVGADGIVVPQDKPTYTLTDADKTAVADAVVADGIAATLVDMPSGGGGGETWVKLVDTILTEAVESVTYTFDNCKRIKALIAPAIANGEFVSGWIRITINNVAYPSFNGKVNFYEGIDFEIDSEYPPYVQGDINAITNTTTYGIISGKHAASLENIAPNGVTEFGCQTAALLKAGTKIEIWGVKS